MKKNIYIMIWGGLGDVVLSTPIFKEFKIQSPDSKIIAICRLRNYISVLENNPYINKFRNYNLFFNLYYKLLVKLKIIEIHYINYGRLRPGYSYTKKAPEIIAEMVGLNLQEKNVQIYLTEKEEIDAKRYLATFPKPCVVINITSMTTKNQMWPIENWNELVTTMPDYTFIQLGVESEEKIAGAIDLRGKTSVRESMALVKHSNSFVGVVSFLSHVTGAFNKPGVVLFGPSSIPVWGHSNNINVIKQLTCSPCVDFLRHATCPYDKLCMRLITVQEIKDAIYKQYPWS